jgi:hypothetical protein
MSIVDEQAKLKQTSNNKNIIIDGLATDIEFA